MYFRKNPILRPITAQQPLNPAPRSSPSRKRILNPQLPKQLRRV